MTGMSEEREARVMRVYQAALSYVKIMDDPKARECTINTTQFRLMDLIDAVKYAEAYEEGR